LNPYIERRRASVSSFFRSLSAVDDVADSLSLDRYTHSTLASGAVRVQLNQIYAMHALLRQFKEKVCLARQRGQQQQQHSTTESATYSAHDPLAIVLTKLGDNVPEQVPRAENISVILRLTDTRATRLSTAVAASWSSAGAATGSASAAVSRSSDNGGSASSLVVHDPFRRGVQSAHGGSGVVVSGVVVPPSSPSNPLQLQAKSLLLSVLRRLPLADATNHPTLLSYLNAQKQASLAAGNHSLCDAVNNVCAMLSTLFNMRLLDAGGGGSSVALSDSQSRELAYDRFFHQSALESLARHRAMLLLSKQRTLVDQALATVTKHHDYLLSRLDVYRLYLDNVRQGQAHTQAAAPSSSSSSSSVQSSAGKAGAAAAASASGSKAKVVAGSDVFVKVAKYSHADLVSMHLIASLDGDISSKVLKHLQYSIEMRAVRGSSALAPRFFLSVSLSKGISIPLLATPVELVLEELLRLQEHSTPTIVVEDTLHLNVNILVHMLNSQFIAHVPKT